MCIIYDDDHLPLLANSCRQRQRLSIAILVFLKEVKNLIYLKSECLRWSWEGGCSFYLNHIFFSIFYFTYAIFFSFRVTAVSTRIKQSWTNAVKSQKYNGHFCKMPLILHPCHSSVDFSCHILMFITIYLHYTAVKVTMSSQTRHITRAFLLGVHGASLVNNKPFQWGGSIRDQSILPFLHLFFICLILYLNKYNPYIYYNWTNSSQEKQNKLMNLNGNISS